MSVKVSFGQNALKKTNTGSKPGLRPTPSKLASSKFGPSKFQEKNKVAEAAKPAPQPSKTAAQPAKVAAAPEPKKAVPNVEVKVEIPKPVEAAGKAPKFVETLQDATGELGKTVIIDCVCTGEPEPDVDWFHNGKMVKDEGRFRYLFEKDDVIGLEIRKLEAGDAGEYKCVAFNKSGKVECKCKISVPEKKAAPAPAAEPAAAPAAAPASKGSSFVPKDKKKKNALPIEREGIKVENPEKYYELGEEIGRGKFAVVKRATEKATKKEWAAKIIKFDTDIVKFAIDEYDLMINDKFKHPGLVTLHEAYLVRKYLILIMDLNDGKSLLEFVSSKHSLTEDDVANYIRQMCEILHHIHSNNFVHLDLRPTNIRFKNNRELQILDYNSARTVKNKKAGQVVDILGDTEFCAPEMLNFDPVSPPSDMWTVAVNMFIMLCGVSPFFDDNEDNVVLNVQRVKYDKSHISHATSEAKDFITSSFHRAPEMRMTAAQALKHKFLSEEYANARKNSKLSCQDTMRETDERLLSEEEEEYIYPSLVLRTFDEEEYESPEESSDEEED